MKCRDCKLYFVPYDTRQEADGHCNLIDSGRHCLDECPPMLAALIDDELFAIFPRAGGERGERMSTLSPNHWTLATYTQRMSGKEWKQVLLDEQDTIVFRGIVCKLVAKSIGCGVVEVSKKVEKEREE